MSALTPDSPSVDVRTCGDAAAIHVALDGVSLVAIGNLRVLIRKEQDEMWTAQGLEIDYCADGHSLDDVQQAFSEGLKLTIRENLRISQSLRGILKTAPPEIWSSFLEGLVENQFTLSHASIHTIAGMSVSFYLPKAA